MADMVSVPVQMTGHCSGCNSNVAGVLNHMIPDMPGSSAYCSADTACGKCGGPVHITGTAQL